jgi:hypothetical protein
MSGSNWANRTKENLQAITTTNNELKPVSSGGTLEPIVAYYRFNAPRDATKASPLSRTIASGQEFLGVYEGSYIDKKYGKPVHKVRTQAGLIALPSAAALDKDIAKVAEGADIQITYTGKAVVQKGPNAGKGFHSFTVMASRLK